jgi:5-methyltetrahydropteroyltriglutamate--homocysteine methyltransferase
MNAEENKRTRPQLLPTSLVGSYPQPDWLIDRATLSKQTPPRTRAQELWKIEPSSLEQAQDDATLLAIRDQERAGIDIVTDGEIRRVSYSNRFATALDGIDLENPGVTLSRHGVAIAVPRVVGKISRRHAVETRDVAFLRANTEKTIKITVPGPFTMAQQVQNDFYKTTEEMAFDYADAVNAEIRDLFASGADVVQIDEPYLQARADEARQYGADVLNRALDGVSGTTALHICFGYALNTKQKAPAYDFLAELENTLIQQISVETAQSKLDCSTLAAMSKTIILGVVDLADMAVETPDVIAARIRRALPFVSAERIVVAPDCGMKYLPRDIAYGKLRAMVEGANIVRKELTG